MKYFNPQVLIPLHTPDGNKHWHRITVNAVIDRRALYRGIRKYISATFNTRVGKEWIKARCIIVGETTQSIKESKKPTTKADQDKLDVLCMALMEEEELEAQSITSTPVQTTASA